MAFESEVVETTSVEAHSVEARAAELNARLRDAHPSEILRAAVAEYGGRLALVSSFGAESAVLLHLAAQIDPSIPVLFLDTGMHFGQTLDYRKQLAAKLPELKEVQAPQTDMIDRLSADVAFVDLFRYPSIRALSAHLTGHGQQEPGDGFMAARQRARRQRERAGVREAVRSS